MPRSALIIGTLSLALSLQLFGCHGGDDSTGPATTLAPATPPVPTPQPTPIPCLPGTQKTFVLSGGHEPGTHIDVDDNLRAYVNGELVGRAGICNDSTTCDEARPIRFHASTGDVLVVEGEDTGCGVSCTETTGQCYRLGALYIQRGNGTCLRQLTQRIESYDCSLPRQTIFLRESLRLP